MRAEFLWRTGELCVGKVSCGAFHWLYFCTVHCGRVRKVKQIKLSWTATALALGYLTFPLHKVGCNRWKGGFSNRTENRDRDLSEQSMTVKTLLSRNCLTVLRILSSIITEDTRLPLSVQSFLRRHVCLNVRLDRWAKTFFLGMLRLPGQQ